MKKKLVLSTIVATALMFSTTSVASASSATTTNEGEVDSFSIVDDRNERAVLTEPERSSSTEYSPRDYIQFLVFASGPIAEDNPSLVKGVHEQVPQLKSISLADMEAFSGKYLSANPDFVESILPKLTSGDPIIVQEAVEAFASDLMAWAQKEAAAEGVIPARMGRSGCNWGSGCVKQWYLAATTAAVGWQVAGLHTVAAVTIVLAAAVIIYLPGESGMNDIDRQRYASNFAAAVAK